MSKREIIGNFPLVGFVTLPVSMHSTSNLKPTLNKQSY